MEIKELIDRLKNNGCYGCPYRPACVDDDTAECAIRIEAAATIEQLADELENVTAERDAALREQEEQENPKPLTLDELRERDGEPVYIVCPGYEHEFPGRWEILERAGSWGWNGIHAEYFESSYEREWLAYRSKPKEDA